MVFFFLLAAAVLSIIALAIILIPMELAFPAKKGQKIFRKAWLLDLTFLLGQYLLWAALVASLLDYFSDNLASILPKSFYELVHSQPIWLQLIEVIFFSDLLIYWGHRLQHNVPFLWRFHKVHHSAERLDWLAAYREHPIDSVYTIGLINLPYVIMGFDMSLIVGVIAFRGIWAIYIHSNVRIPLGPLRMIIGAPELHHWHHDLDRNAGNYANLSPLMDLLFGTYVCPDHEPEKVGIKEEFPKNYVGQMLEPIIGKEAWTELERPMKKYIEPTDGILDHPIKK
jgi:sterol desaturase/sphingolipid hydroxylase (fatty acid hydroxylase superfamily)